MKKAALEFVRWLGMPVVVVVVLLVLVGFVVKERVGCWLEGHEDRFSRHHW